MEPSEDNCPPHLPSSPAEAAGDRLPCWELAWKPSKQTGKGTV